MSRCDAEREVHRVVDEFCPSLISGTTFVVHWEDVHLQDQWKGTWRSFLFSTFTD